MVLVVLVLVIAAGFLTYYRMTNGPAGAEGAPPSELAGPILGPSQASPANTERPYGEEEVASRGSEAAPANPAATGEDERTSLILELALASLPGWEGKIVAHDDNWISATVRATSPDGKVKLDVRVSWDTELGDYEVVSATPVAAPQRATTRKSVIPQGVVEAIVSRPTFSALPDRKLIPKEVTEKTAVIAVQGGGAQWRVTLERRGEKWVITEARKLQPLP